MKTITLPNVSEALHRKLEARAQAHHRTVEEEAVRCLEELIETDEALLAAIPRKRWERIEEALVLALHDSASDLTQADLARYRDLASSDNAR
jgi:coenzyme F420-reducing hydrogenase gamma subunit